MGDIKVFNNAGVNDTPETVTTVNGTTARVIDLFATKAETEVIKDQVDVNTQNVTEVVQDAPEALNTFKEVSDELDIDSFMNALEGD